MSGGGGGGTSTTTQSIPDELKPLASAYTDKAIDLSNQGYTPYTGQQYADLNNTQNQAISMIQDRAQNGSQIMDSANSALTVMLSDQTNPYLDSMVNQAQQNVIQNYNTANVNSGSFGNSGLQEALAKGLSDTATTMYGNAYNTDQANKLSALGMAQSYGNQDYTDAAQMLSAGQLQQDTTQNNLNAQYQSYLDEQNLPYKQLAAMSGVFGTNLGGTSTTNSDSGGK